MRDIGYLVNPDVRYALVDEGVTVARRTRIALAMVTAAAVSIPIGLAGTAAAAGRGSEGQRSSLPPAATRIAVDPSIRSLPFGGWGTSLAWFANYTGDWANREEMADLLFSTTNTDAEPSLGLSLVRYNIGGGDNPANAGALRPGADVPSYRPDPDRPYDWDADANQRWWLDAAIDRVPEDDFAVDAIAYSAPYWITQSGRSTGNVSGDQDNLLPGYEDEFAGYLADVVEHFDQERGITFRNLSPLNESATDYWKVDGRQEGMHVSPGANQAAILNATYDALQDRNLATGLSGVDETGIDFSLSDFASLKATGFDLNRLDQINVHTYSGGDRVKMHQLAVGSAQKRLQMSEVTIGTGAHDHDSTEAYLSLASSLALDLRELQPQEWVYWQAIESESESIDGNGNWGFVHYTSDGSEEYEITRKFHAMRQYTNFIRPGDEFVYTSNRKTTSSYDPESKELTLVTYNNKDTAVNVSYDLSNFSKIGNRAEVYRTSPTEERAELKRAKTGDDALTVSLAPQSITTFVVRVSGADAVLVGNGDFETGAAGQNPIGWLTRGGDAYGSYLESDYTQAGGGETGLQEAVHYSGGDYDVYTYQRKELDDGVYTLRALVGSNSGPSTSEMVVSGYGGERRSVAIPVGEERTNIEITDIRVTDGKIEFGFHSLSSAGRFITFDEVQLLRQ